MTEHALGSVGQGIMVGRAGLNAPPGFALAPGYTKVQTAGEKIMPGRRYGRVILGDQTVVCVAAS